MDGDNDARGRAEEGIERIAGWSVLYHATYPLDRRIVSILGILSDRLSVSGPW